MLDDLLPIASVLCRPRIPASRHSDARDRFPFARKHQTVNARMNPIPTAAGGRQRPASTTSGTRRAGWSSAADASCPTTAASCPASSRPLKLRHERFCVRSPSFIEGASRVLDLFGTLQEYNKPRKPQLADHRAMFDDFRAIGTDLKLVIKRYEETLIGGTPGKKA